MDNSQNGTVGHLPAGMLKVTTQGVWSTPRTLIMESVSPLGFQARMVRLSESRAAWELQLIESGSKQTSAIMNFVESGLRLRIAFIESSISL